ncbi:CBS domain-containing protein [Limimaricola cinnabarinus]|uniref:Inosine-5'-monophosphate dehydrogenase n=1 Tax=Limimaricola cinnabarinus LL-001 TaxID=1337093 RepID=U2Z8H9_9RHOB|nr:CBS domain-containing protein [Limimaricola cinnabarinus]GAD57337.1 inosine-5'-monophosphate dehydrogenase [Limimaricola cinnabarinus LL-001]
MLVQQILKSKANDTVATVTPDTTVAEAARQLSDKRIGALVVSQDGKRAQGIISERDIVREIGRRGPDCLEEKVAAMMTADPVTCHREEVADHVLARMTEGRFRHIPVVDGEEMIGLISIGDVVKARLSELSMEKDALEGMIMGH